MSTSFRDIHFNKFPLEWIVDLTTNKATYTGTLDNKDKQQVSPRKIYLFWQGICPIGITYIDNGTNTILEINDFQEFCKTHPPKLELSRLSYFDKSVNSTPSSNGSVQSSDGLTASRHVNC